MSGSRKHVREAIAASADEVEEMLAADSSMVLVRVTEMRGAHCEVETATGERMLAMLPAKFKSVVWIKRGNFALLRQGQVPADGTRFKLRGALAHILTPDQVAKLRKRPIWPAAFAQPAESASSPVAPAETDAKPEIDPFESGNPNRRHIATILGDDEDDEAEEEEEEESKEDDD